MNPANATIAVSPWAQARPQTASFLRPVGETGRFGDVLSGLLGPETPGDAGPGTVSEDAETETGADDPETGDGVEQPESAEGDPADGASAGADEATPEVTGGRHHAATETHSTAGIARELTHAATVDLAEVAREQLVDPKSSPKHRPPEHDPLHTPPVRPPITASNPGGGDGATPPWSASTPGSPNKQPDVGGSAGAIPVAKAPGSDVPLRAGSPGESAGVNASEPARNAAAAAPVARTEGASLPPADGRAMLLQRLTGSAEAGRGAVAAPDRVGYQIAARDQAPSRPAVAIADAAPRQTREAVLNSVQRGLASVLGQGGGRMTVVLRPEQLGEVRVRLEAKDGVVNARLAATTDAARRTLESGLDTLRAALEARGVRVESLTVDSPESTAGTSQGPVDPDGRGQGSERREPDAHRRPRAGGDEAAPMPEAADSSADAGIWTELGIDAVA